MADGEGIFTRLGRMLNNALANGEQAIDNALQKAEIREANSALQDVAHVRQAKPLFSKGLLAHWEQAIDNVVQKAEITEANSALQDVAHARQMKPLFSVVNTSPEIHIHGGESVHTAPKASATPSVPKVMDKPR